MAKKTFLGFIRDQFQAAAPVVDANLKGKTVIVIGANTGLGFEAIRHFAKMGAGKLILARRNREKGEAATRRLREATGYSGTELWLVDLAQFASVKTFADRATKDLERLDILLLSAGIAPTDPYLQVNGLSISLLGLLLLPKMLETGKRYNTTPRIVVVSSDGHYWTEVEDKVLNSPNTFDVLGSKEYCPPVILKTRYMVTKLLNVFFTRALSNHLKDQPVIIDTVNLGFSRPAEEGGRQLIWAAVGIPEGRSENTLRGAYIDLARVDEPADFVLGEEGKNREEKLWTDLISVLERVDPRVKEVVRRYLISD